MNVCLKPRIVAETDDYIAVEKPHGMKTAPQSQNESDTLLSWVLDYCPECTHVRGRQNSACNDYGLIHRLDTVTHGLVLVAKTNEFFDYMMKQQAADKIEKIYKAVVSFSNVCLSGFPPAEVTLQNGIVIRSAFRAYGEGRRAVRPVTGNGGRAAKKKGSSDVYSTRCVTVQPASYRVASADQSFFSVTCTIMRGFRHQIRCHLAWLGYPIAGDVLYGGIPAPNVELHAESVSFYPSFDKPLITISL